MTDPRDTMRWVWRGAALAALLIGWIFIAWQNHFHITAPVVFVCLAYLAVVATVYNLWRTGAAAVNPGEDEDDSTWAKPTGRLGELEREKRTLLKAIKEAEFDHQMGKLSQRDAEEMIRMYRARAIEVIKEIDHLGLGAAGTPREQILREVRARIELDAKAQGKEPRKASVENGVKGKGRKQAAKDARDTKAEAAKAGAAAASTEAASSAAAATPATPATPATSNAASASDAASAASASASQAAAESASSDAAGAESSGAAPRAAEAPIGAAALDDEAMDADSTTAVESTRNQRTKEAAP